MPKAAPILRPGQFWEQVARCEGMQRRIERLGYTREEVNNILMRAAAHKPTRANLNLIRANAERRAAYLAPPRELPATKTIIRAFFDVQKGKVYRIYLLSTGLLQFWRFAEKRALAARMSPAGSRGTTSTGITGYQEPTWWRGDIALRGPVARGVA